MAAAISVSPHGKKRRASGWLPAIPVVALLGTVFFYPVLSLLSTSLTDPVLGLQHYQRIAEEPLYLLMMWRTAWIAMVVTLATAVVGYPLAYYLASARPSVARFAMLMLFIPFWASILVRTYGIMVIMGRTGVLNNALIYLGIIDRPIQFMFNTVIVQVAMVQILLPFFVLPLYSVLKTIDPNLTQAARGLGASSWNVFSKVYFPLSLPGVYAGGLIVLVFSFGFFIVPSLIGGRRDVTLPMLIIQQFQGQINWGFGAAVGVLLLACTLVVIGLSSRLVGADKLAGR